jgi:hypothetical protein
LSRRSVIAGALLILLTACASGKAPLAAPDWDTVPEGVVTALCRRLQMDALATGNTAIVRVTQPLATPESLAALAGTTAAPGSKRQATGVTNRAIPITLGRGSCAWQPIDVRQAAAITDAMVVELSAPLLHPYNKNEAGLLARVSLAEQHPSWYWISMVPRKGEWAVRYVSVLFQ